MKPSLAPIAVIPCLFGCSSPEPTIDLAQLIGEYVHPSCPSITVGNGKLSYAGEQSSFEIIRIKEHNILTTSTTPRYVRGKSCALVRVTEPTHIQIDILDEQPTFTISSAERSHEIRYVRMPNGS